MAEWSKVPTEKIQAIVDGSGDAATVAWAQRGEGSLATLSDPMLAIAAAVALGNVSALQAVNSPKDLKKAAGMALHRLRSSGVKVQAAVAPVTFKLANTEVLPPSRAFVSLPMKEGEVEFLLTATDDEGSCALAVIAGGGDGVVEVNHAHLQRSEMRNTWKQAEGHGLKEIPFTAGLHFVDRILGPRNESNYRHFLGHVPHGVLMAAKVVDPLANVPAVDEDPEKVGKDWTVPPGLWDAALVNTVMEEMVAESSENITDNNFYDRVVERIAGRLWDPKRKPDWLRHLNLLREVFLLHGRVLSAKQVEEFVVALEGGADPGSFAPVVNSVKMALLDEVMAKFNQGGEFGREADFEDENFGDEAGQ